MNEISEVEVLDKTEFETQYLLWDFTVSLAEKDIKDINVVAKAIKNKKTDKYKLYIKAAKGFLYNPLSPRHNVQNRYIHIHWKWREVDAEAMREYMEFVKTRNELHYKHAERMKTRYGK